MDWLMGLEPTITGSTDQRVYHSATTNIYINGYSGPVQIKVYYAFATENSIL